MNKYKVAVIGPESTGKSELVEKLAAYYNCQYIVEYARDYIEALDRPYVYEDILKISKKQKELEKEAFLKSDSLLICDSSMITNKVWSYDKFSKCEPWIEDEMDREFYDLFLLCYPDLPWQSDPVREDEHRREHLFQVYEDFLKEHGQSYEVISGVGESRLRLAIQYIDKLMPIS